MGRPCETRVGITWYTVLATVFCRQGGRQCGRRVPGRSDDSGYLRDQTRGVSASERVSVYDKLQLVRATLNHPEALAVQMRGPVLRRFLRAASCEKADISELRAHSGRLSL